MIFKRKQKVRLFSIIGTFLMMLSLVTPAFAVSETNENLHRSVNDTKLAPKEKISNRLLGEFDDQEEVTFLVKFTEKAKVKKVAREAENKINLSNMSGQEAQLLKRSAILSELKATSYKSHKNVIGYLDEEKKAGTVSDYRSYHIVNGMAVTATKEVAEKIASFHEVEKILKNETRQLQTTFEEKAVSPQADSDEIEWNVDRIDAPDAWEKGIDGTGTVVASLDTGAEWDHPGLKEKYRGYDASTGEVDHQYSFYDATLAGQNAAYDDNGHGTHVTGTMVGSEPDGSNQIGVAPGAEWTSVKVFDDEGNTTDDILLDGAEWLLAPGGRIDLAPDVVNNSWSGGTGIDEWYWETVENWREYGIFPEFSAGNKGTLNPGGPGSIANPANYPISFATGATDSDDLIADFSLRGPSPYDEIKPDISAPGVNIRSSIPGGGYDLNSGTSMAGPSVAAVAAMLRQAMPDITVDDMEEILMSTATERTDEEYPESPNNGYGHGIVNANDAISTIVEGVGTVEGKVTNTEDTPLDAHVNFLESGRMVSTNPDDGSYSILHPSGTFIVEASAYGFESDQQSVTVENGETSTADFTLDELTQGDINGSVIDENTGDPIAGARILLVEDANVELEETDKEGNFLMTAYEGTYTLKAMARGYDEGTVEVTVREGTVDVSIELTPYYTYPGGEIGYDDGTADNALANVNHGNSYAVKMSLPEGKESAVVTDGVFKFWDEDFPDPGDTEFAIEVWDASGTDGLPGERIAGPFEADAIRDKEKWTVVDLRDYNIFVEEDFYMVYVQTDDLPNVPGLSTDETGPYANRSYEYYKSTDSWVQSTDYWGNFMIRSRVAYEVEEPVITSPEKNMFTNEEIITIEGMASPDTTAQLMNNDEEVGTVEVEDDGKFSFTTTLSEGDNELTVATLLDGSTVESESVSVTLDSIAPELTIDNPVDGEKSNRETVTVEGTVFDENLDSVEVNGQKADIDGGEYSKRILLDNGENVIEVTAVDLVGNTTTETVTIDVKYDAPEISNLTPDENMDLETGQSVKIEFDSEPGLRATFVVHMPLTNMGDGTAMASNPTELPMMEMADGKYVGYWTVPMNAYANGARIEVRTGDGYGNETREVAEGKLFINLDK